MSTEFGDSARSSSVTLEEFDRMQRESGRFFYSLVCEKFGDDLAAYERLTNELIAEGEKRGRTRAEVIKGILRSFDQIAVDPASDDNIENSEKIHRGKMVWYDMLKSMQRS